MAKILSLTGIQTGLPVEAPHVSQSIKALTGAEAYDVIISGSLVVNGLTYPIVDGVSGSVITTDGAGNLTLAQNNAVSASYITSSGVDGPFGMDSIQSASYAATASTADFATNASSSQVAISALSAQSATSASYALTASYVEKINSVKFDFTNQVTVPVTHGLGSESIVVQVYEETGSLDPVMILPDDITINSNNQVTVTLSRPTSGYVTISGGGFLRSGSIQNAQSASWVARTNRTLTQGTGIEAFSFDGSSDATVSFDDDYVVPSASYALTASFALNVPQNVETASFVTGSDVYGPYGSNSIISASHAETASYFAGFTPYRLDFANQTNLTVTHNIGSNSLTVQVYRNDASTSFVPTLMVPGAVRHGNLNQTTLTFTAPTTGYVVITRGGFIANTNTVSSSYALTASYALNADVDTGSFVLTSSITGFTQSFTKGDGTVYENLLPTTATIDTSSFVLTSSIEGFTQSFTLGDGSTYDNIIESASFASTASYAVTASYVDQIFTERFDFTNVPAFGAVHSLNTENVLVQVYEVVGANDPQLIIPDDVFIRNANLVTVTFARNTTGYIVVTRGGIVQSGVVQSAVTASYIDNTYKQDVSGGTVYAITHDLGEEFPIVQAYELTTRAQEIPASVVSAGPQSVVVTFATVFEGTIIVKK